MSDIPEELRKRMIEDLMRSMDFYRPAWKDIYIVVHNQLNHVRQCIESVMKNTQRYSLWIWDNGSDDETREYLADLSGQGKISLHRSEQNMGFVEPSNQLFATGMSEFAILLNSDTEVAPGWDRAMLSCLQNNPYVGVVGYQGCLLDEAGKGGRLGSGYDIDYVAGWCFAVRRSDVIGPLFDSENLKFAYGEDSDLALRLRERGLVPYALYLELVAHHENKTVQEVAQCPQMAAFMRETFEANHAYLRRRWADYLTKDRVSLRSSPGEL